MIDTDPGVARIRGQEPFDLLLPLRDQAGRCHHQRGTPVWTGWRMRGNQGEGLDRLAQSHIICQDTAVPVALFHLDHPT